MRQDATNKSKNETKPMYNVSKTITIVTLRWLRACTETTSKNRHQYAVHSIHAPSSRHSGAAIYG